jgi:protein ImuB
VRTLVVWCEDWSVVAATQAAGIPAHLPAAVIGANQVLACSVIARRAGVRRGLRRRQAQVRCPELVVLGPDPDRDARLFEPMVAAVEELVPGLQVISPGVVAAPASGAARYFGTEDLLGERLIDEVAQRTGLAVGIGIADGLFAALLAAHRGLLVPAGTSPAFLAPLDIGEIEQPEVPGWGDRDGLVNLLRRLGLHTLGAFAALSPTDVASRFPHDVVVAHRLARGLTAQPIAGRRPPPDLTVTMPLDPPVERIDAAAFAAKMLADRFSEHLSGLGLACVQLRIEAVTENGEEYSRVWRHEGSLSTSAIAERTRWQLEGWLCGRAVAAPTAGVSLLRLHAESVVPRAGLQLGLWGGWGETEERVHRALTRLQGMLGPEAVRSAIVAGGRHPGEQGLWVAWQEESRSARGAAAVPWPGKLPGPHPVSVLKAPEPVDVHDIFGNTIGVSARHLVTAVPHVVIIGGRSQRVLAWAGPWPVDERWWDPAAGRRRARFHVLLGPPDTGPDRADAPLQAAPGDTVDGDAFLLTLESGRWSIEGVYD